MRPLPEKKTHGVIHTINVKKEDLEDLARKLNIPDDRKHWLKEGEIHILREAKPEEMSKAGP
jgi:hypothetical protein